MHIRTRTAATTAVAAAAAAFAVLPAAGTSTAASTAASGGVEYTYADAWGRETTAVLVDPEDGACIALPELAHTPAFRIDNRSTSPALLYGDKGCHGEPRAKVLPGDGSEVATYAVRLVPDED
ncbi:hypothetical protein [Streptomyces sp. NPDC048603]|uniref:hypothetical protein n=1 Tax=Streptomyces sp. NPDC048603 TaxID=3365577 RepID=UPI003715D2D5